MNFFGTVSAEQEPDTMTFEKLNQCVEKMREVFRQCPIYAYMEREGMRPEDGHVAFISKELAYEMGGDENLPHYVKSSAMIAPRDIVIGKVENPLGAIAPKLITGE